jgi:hypothetical protein
MITRKKIATIAMSGVLMLSSGIALLASNNADVPTPPCCAPAVTVEVVTPFFDQPGDEEPPETGRCCCNPRSLPNGLPCRNTLDCWTCHPF